MQIGLMLGLGLMGRGAATAPVITAAAPRFWGMATPGSEINDAYPGLANEAAAYAAIGAGTVRFDFRPSDLWNGSAYTWTTQDAVVAALRAQGLQIVGILNGTGSYVGNLDTGDERAFYASFAAAVAARYANDVIAWEICNEPNLASTAIAPADYCAALLLAYPAIKAAAPDAIVLAGSLASVQSDGSGHYGAAGYAQAIYDNAPASFDGLSYHAYTDSATVGWRTNDGHGWHSRNILLTQIGGVMAAEGDTTRQVWITETGMPTGAASSPPSEWWQTKWLRDIHDDLAADRRIARLNWYSYINRQAESPGNGTQDFFGLRKASGAGKRVLPEWSALGLLYSDLTPAFETSKAASGSVSWPLWRWFQSPANPRGNDLSISIDEALPTGFSLSSGVLTVNRATAAAQLATPLTVRATKAGATAAMVQITVTVFNQNLHAIDDFGVSAAVTGWTAAGANATVSFDSGSGALLCDITGVGGGYQSSAVTVVASTVYERGILLKKGTYGGTLLNVFMDNVATSPSTLTVPTDWEWRWFTYTQGDTSANVSITRNGSFTGTIYVAREILRVKL